jgi:aromatic-L-amino-acid/L-tryptophan decarboxylase
MVCICLGTVNTGAFDNLAELASIAHEENMWFHVDGAFGSLVILDSQQKYLVAGIEHADSLAFDFHKWLHCPYDAGCVLVRRINDLRATFSKHQSYLSKPDRGCTGDLSSFFDLGPEVSRSFRALKIWCIFKEHGIQRLGEKIADNCQQAQYLVKQLEQYADVIYILRPVTLNIVNFRFEPITFDKNNYELIDTFNRELVADIQLTGIALPSSTVVNNRLYIRVCIMNHRSTNDDVDIFLDIALKMYHRRMQT